jgi:large subunit ribosomal protein L5
MAKAEKPEKAEKPQKGEKKAKAPKPKPAEAEAASASEEGNGASEPEDVPEPRLRERYKKEVVKDLMKRFEYTSSMQVPRLDRIVINMGLGAAVGNPKVIDNAVEELKAITGQKPVITRAKKAIANFKLREGLPIGVKVTLRRERMWEFMDRLVTLALPRVRDFRGTSPRAFDGAGNYTLGLKEQIVFPEINFDSVDSVKGMNITFVTTARTNEEAKELLARLGMPFRS